MRLGSVLEHEQAVGLRDLVDRIHVAHLAIQMDGNDRRSAWRDGRPRGLRVDQARGLVDLAQDRRRARVHGAQRRGDERVRRNDHLIPGADAGGPEHQRQGRRP